MPQKITPDLRYSYFINFLLLSSLVSEDQWAKGSFKFVMHARRVRIATRRQEEKKENKKNKNKKLDDDLQVFDQTIMIISSDGTDHRL